MPDILLAVFALKQTSAPLNPGVKRRAFLSRERPFADRSLWSRYQAHCYEEFPAVSNHSLCVLSL